MKIAAKLKTIWMIIVRINYKQKANYHELIIDAKNKVMMLENEIRDADDLIDLVWEQMRKTRSINVKAALITVLFMGSYHEDFYTGNMIFYMPTSKDCLQEFKYVRKRISKGKSIRVNFNRTRAIDENGDYCYDIDVAIIY